MANVKEVAALNSKIEKINLERTKVKTQQELLQKRLEEELAQYKDSFGIDLLGTTLKETKANIMNEVSEVSKVVDEEYALKEKVVKAIEDGDYDYANNLMGIGTEKEEIATQVVNDIIEQGINSDGESEAENEVASTNVDESEEETLYPTVNEEVLNVPKLDEEDEDSLKAKADAFSMDEDDVEEDEDEFDLGIEEVSANDFLNSVASATKTNIEGSTIEEASKDLTGGLKLGDLVFEDEDDDIDDDFGFGDMLSGTKFE